jgi:hypothetical protein
MQEREAQPVQGFNGRKRREPGGLGHYRPAHYPGGGSEHRGTGRAETVEQGAAGKEEHHRSMPTC